MHVGRAQVVVGVGVVMVMIVVVVIVIMIVMVMPMSMPVIVIVIMAQHPGAGQVHQQAERSHPDRLVERDRDRLGQAHH